jgi:nicotinamide-nucleotide amidase
MSKVSIITIENEVVPLLKQRLASHSLMTVTFHTTGISESRIQEQIGEIDGIAFLPHLTGIDLRISRKTKDELGDIRKFLKSRLGKAIYGEDDDTLEAVIGRLLKDSHLTIGVAESLTGGLVMHRLTNVPGSSKYFLGGVVAYSNKLKRELLGVKEETLKGHGAVSKEIALEMASGIRESAGADIGASTTGIAGPTGGTREKPVGLVYTAVCGKKRERCEKNLFKGDRLMIKEMSAQKVLDMIRTYITS